MARTFLSIALFSMVFAGFESASDAADPVWDEGHTGSHELHGQAHSESHDHDDDSLSGDHYCHCSVHAAALLSVDIAPSSSEAIVAISSYDDRFTSLVAPPLLRPPNS